MKESFKMFCLLLGVLFIAGCGAQELELGIRNPATAVEAKELQERTASELGIPIEKDIALNKTTSMTFVLIPAGEFHMGSPKSEKKRAADEWPLHHVKISKSFYMGKYEVTQAQYKAILGKLHKKCKFEGDYLPVENINWNNAYICLRELSIKKRMKFRLPTEAEWEYACRAGTTTPFNTGETISAEQANYDSRYIYGNGVSGGYMGMTTPVGSFPPNAFGLYDMNGNVWEWCSDFYDKEYYRHSKAVDPKGPASGKTRVIRGGSWNHNPNKLRSADRNRRMYGADKRYLGFRAVLEIE